MHLLDDLDIMLITLLQENGRRPAAELAREVDVPLSTVRRRVERLLNDGVIQVVALVQEPEKLGLLVHAFLALRVAPSDEKGVAQALCACDEIRWVSRTTGTLNLRAEGFFRSQKHLHTFYWSEIATRSAIQEAQMDVILDLYKNRFDWAAMAQVESSGVVEDSVRHG